MALKRIHIRLPEEQLQIIDERVKAGVSANRSAAIQDCIRRMETLSLCNRLLDILETKPLPAKQLNRTRQKLWDEKYAQLLARDLE